MFQYCSNVLHFLYKFSQKRTKWNTPSKLIFPFFLVSAWLTSKSISLFVSFCGILFKRHFSSLDSMIPSPDTSHTLKSSRTSCWVSCAIFFCIRRQNSSKSTAPLSAEKEINVSSVQLQFQWNTSESRIEVITFYQFHIFQLDFIGDNVS